MIHRNICFLLVFTVLLQITIAHSVDDADKKENPSRFPVDGTLISVNEDNFELLLSEQLPENIMNPKKHRPLVLGLVTRDGKGSLDFQRELHKLAKTVYRNFAVSIGDCHFERRVCEVFRPANFPVLYLFNDGKLFRWTQRDEYTLEMFLDYLSGDNYVAQSVEMSSDSS